MKRLTILIIILTLSFAWGQAPNAWINEFHYDNTGTDAGEAAEVVVPSTYTDLSNFTLSLYNGSSTSLAVYDSHTLDSFTAGATVNGFTIYYMAIAGIQNGAPDGLALDYSGTLIQFISYEGSFTAASGVASGVTSTDIGVAQDGTGVAGLSLQLGGSSNVYSGFTWQTEATATFGAVNTNQTILSSSADTPPIISAITISPETPESTDAVTVSATITDDSAVSSASLAWGTDGSTYPNTITMTVSSGDVYVIDSNIPAQSEGTTVYFTITATDDASQSSTSAVQSYMILGEVTIYAIQSGAVVEGSIVMVTGIVTAGTGETPDGYGNSFYIQDGTGQYSGINIYASSFTVSRGDEITVTGTYTEYSDKSEIDDVTDITINSSGNTVPAAEVLTLGQSDWEPWEGVLITIEDVYVSAEAGTYGEWEVTDGTNTMIIDNAYNDHYTYSPVLNDEFDSITGPLNYSYSAFKIIPRDDDDLVAAIDPTVPIADAGEDQNVDFGVTVTLDGTGSYDPDGVIVGYLWEQLSGTSVTLSDYEEATVTFTAPSVVSTLVFQLTVYDNTAKEATDELTVQVGSMSIYSVQFNTEQGSGDDCFPSPYLDEQVTLSGIVTHVKSGTYHNFFIQQPDCTTWAGVYVYDNTVNPTTGDEVTITADVDEYFGLTEIKNVTSSAVNSSGNNIEPIVINTGTLGILCSADAEQYEGMLVKVEVATVDSTNEHGNWYVNDGTGTAIIDDYFFDGTWTTPDNGTVYLYITGVVDYSFGEFMICPRTSTDIYVSNAVDSPVIADRFMLLSNYPNPFNPVTTIFYRVTETGPATLMIYDLLGNRIDELVNDELLADRNYSLQWNGTDRQGKSLPSGIYFARLSSGSETLTQKITLLK